MGADSLPDPCCRPVNDMQAGREAGGEGSQLIDCPLIVWLRLLHCHELLVSLARTCVTRASRSSALSCMSAITPPKRRSTRR